jgi:hypothetical protein
LIRKWLNAGVIEDGEWSEAEKGTPQGAVISPLLANIYLHYVLDQWTDQWRQRAQGDVIIVRYADDAVIGFQHQYEAERFLKDVREQLGKYGLELNEEKTRLIRFGRFARQNRDERGEGKPESFTFLGFQPICGENSVGRFEVRRYYRRRPTAEETARHQAANPPEDARTGSAGRRMAEERTQRLLPIPCSPGKSDGAETISATGRPLLVPGAGTAQPKAAHLGKAGETIRSLATCSTHCSCLSRRAIPRQSPSGGKSKVRTVCGSAASTGLCGGQRATAVPTATVSVRNPEND